jgi:hypothetical protein
MAKLFRSTIIKIKNINPKRERDEHEEKRGPTNLQSQDNNTHPNPKPKLRS